MQQQVLLPSPPAVPSFLLAGSWRRTTGLSTTAMQQEMFPPPAQAKSIVAGLWGITTGPSATAMQQEMFPPPAPPPPLFFPPIVAGLTGNNEGTISNSYATGNVSVNSSANFFYGGLVGNNEGTISGSNYFVDSSGTNGLGSGTCSGTCTQKTLAELQALTSVTDWSTDNWGFGAINQLPRVKYAPTATYCSDDTHTTQQACEDASETWVIEGCGGDTGVTCGDVIPGQ